MYLKPKNTYLNKPALLYRRFTSLDESKNLLNVYKTVDNKMWTFDSENLKFEKISSDDISTSTSIINITNDIVLLYQKYYAFYDNAQKKWIITDDLNTTGKILLSAKFNNIAKYQTNRYYFVASFDYQLKGSENTQTGQFIKGNITPISSMNIKYTNDYINIQPDDLVVCEGRLYSVESIEKTVKHQPKPLNIYYATLNSIL